MDIERCQVCGKPAHVHSCEIRNGQKTEQHLCHEHAGAAITGFDVEQQIRQAVSLCCALIPKDKRSSETVAGEFRRLVERALSDLQEDAEAFGFGSESDQQA